MKSNILSALMITSYATLNTTAIAEETITLDPIVIGADFREKKLSQTSNSVTVIGEGEIYDKASKPLIETLASTPNVNFSSGASKAKYIQIRGIGERSQYTTPVNPSVGVISDGIDFSQSTLGLNLFDVKQVEVLRGPQGTTFGANGMAGVINVESNEPTSDAGGRIETTIGNYNSKAVGIAINAPIIENKLLSRFSLYKNTSDGYIKNIYLGRDDTNNIDELTAKVHLKWIVSDDHQLDININHTNINNGYDAWTYDSTRNSYSDEPGKDKEDTNAFSLKSTYQLNSKMHLVSSLSHSKSDLEYSYDEDWYNNNANVWSSFKEYQRDRKQTDIDLRLVSDEDGRIFNGYTDWTIGTYFKDYSEKMNEDNNSFSSDYKTRNKAIYGQLDTYFTDKLTLISGLRVEKWESDYNDSASINIDTNEVLFGGKFGLNYQATENSLYYTTLSKGYKPGGVNSVSRLALNQKEYETETLWNLDLGVNNSHFDDIVKSRLNFFYGKRKDQQVKDYLDRINPWDSWDEYLTNGGESTYYGLESQLDYYPNDVLHLHSSLGLLKSKFDDYKIDRYDMTGRTPANSPIYQYNVGFDYFFFDAWTFKANVEGKGSAYFSDSHNEKAASYELFNTSLEYTDGSFTVSTWIRNIADKEYEVRGFYFGNNPANGWTDELYTQAGAPRTLGLTLSYDF